VSLHAIRRRLGRRCGPARARRRPGRRGRHLADGAFAPRQLGLSPVL